MALQAGPTASALRVIDTTVGVVACVAAGIMTLVVSAEVFARYVLNGSVPFSNELSRVMFIWTVFLGLPLALSRGRHVAITLLDQSLPPAAARFAMRLSCVAAIVLLAVVFYKSVELTVRNWDQMLNTIPVSAGVFYVPIPIGIGVCILYFVIMLVHAQRQLIEDGEGEGAP